MLQQNQQQQQQQLTLTDSLLDHQAFQIADDVLYRQVEAEAILLSISGGTYYSLNETSIFFWEALQNQQPLASAVNRIVDEYEVERSQVLTDLQELLQDLSAYGLIRPIE